MNILEKANQYIKDERKQVVDTYRHAFHVMPPIGWLNDPNGFVFFRGEYHLFYQFYPYASEWGPMHWGHVKSKDLVNWVELPVALAPEFDYELDGCFSGSAIVKDDKLYLMYTGHCDRDDRRREVQCLAVSEDGIHFNKLADNPIIDERQLQTHGDIADFRDPKVFEHDGFYYTVVATKTENYLGRILMFQSKDLINWSFYSVLLEGQQHQGIMWECPDLFELDGKDVLIMSPIEMDAEGHSYHNMSSTVAFIGEMDWVNGKLTVENYHEIDGGLDFYAPQTCENDQGQRLMIAWMQMWKRNIPTHELGHGWSGSMTFVRELSVTDNRLCQRPVKGLYEALDMQFEQYQVAVTDENSWVSEPLMGSQSYARLVITPVEATAFNLRLFEIEQEDLFLSYDLESEILTVNRGNLGYPLKGVEKKHLVERSMNAPLINGQLELEFIRDQSSIEIFINQRDTMTFTFYQKRDGQNIQVTSNGKLTIEQAVIAEVKTN
ncbi:glycoside hydrolase family 32 protein [Vagococcus vulneris]|uniref:Sucrose-6-phosphate hydrolase n=1 Tax=Vagococcus vulneris TaxID=1977869 RepID=A0A429ZZS0_9ENTE|nr:glycoside hydrolase family 32 protein [Vagococcus vulneris]RST99517.1 sucrose-6-phosphate hydrolase [Vagococcus vulneris]